MGELRARLDAPPVFVVGHHRSGTTWVFDILSHPDEVAGVFESWIFTTDHGLGGPLDWGHWSDEHIGHLEGVVGRRPGIGQLVSRDEVVEACRELVEDWLSRAVGGGQRYLVEKSPDHLYSIYAISQVFPDARFVNVVRDGRDVAVSRRAARSWGLRSLGGRGRQTYRTARRWRNAIEYARKASDYVGDRFMDVSYEALESDPEATVAELLAFCGLPADTDAVRAAIEATDFQRNWAHRPDEFRRKGRSGQWRDELGILDRLAFHLAAGRTLIETGYARSPLWWLRA